MQSRKSKNTGRQDTRTTKDRSLIWHMKKGNVGAYVETAHKASSLFVVSRNVKSITKHAAAEPV